MSKSKIERQGKGNSIISFPKDYVVLDLETTGLSPSCDEIIEFCGLKVNKDEVIDTFSTLVKPEYEIDEFITDLTGISNEMVQSAPLISEVMPSIIDFIGDNIIVGHNVGFDINFLYDYNKECTNGILSNDYIDTMRISRKLHPDNKHHRLCDLVDYYSVDTKSYHRAEADCYSTLECLKKLKEEVMSTYGNEQEFTNLFIRKHFSHPVDARTITTDKTDFDTTHPLYGKVCVFTGTLERMERKHAMQMVVDLGGECGNGVTKSTNYLILGNNDYCPQIKDGKSSKQKKAEAYKLKGCDIEIIPENVFYDMIEG